MKAERLSPEGNALWEKLRTECAEKYMDYEETAIKKKYNMFKELNRGRQ